MKLDKAGRESQLLRRAQGNKKNKLVEDEFVKDAFMDANAIAVDKKGFAKSRNVKSNATES